MLAGLLALPGLLPGRLARLLACFLAGLLARLLALRNKVICTASVLQAELARKKKVTAETSGICKVLKGNGYQWCVRKSQKRSYSDTEKAARVTFGKKVKRMTPRALRERLSFAIDGAVFIIPPTDPTARANHCHGFEKYVWEGQNRMGRQPRSQPS